jgi:hypothetical protein
VYQPLSATHHRQILIQIIKSPYCRTTTRLKKHRTGSGQLIQFMQKISHDGITLWALQGNYKNSVPLPIPPRKIPALAELPTPTAPRPALFQIKFPSFSAQYSSLAEREWWAYLSQYQL